MVSKKGLKWMGNAKRKPKTSKRKEEMREEIPSKLLLLLHLLLPLPSLSTFHPQDDYLLTFPSSTPLLTTPNSTHFISPTSPPFSFPLSSNGPHILRIHFHLLPTPSSHLFTILVSNFSLLTNFSPPSRTPTTKEFFFFNLNLPSLTLSFYPSPPGNISFVNAIELYSVPRELIFGLDWLEGHVVEVVHRVNVGGEFVGPGNDTLWRSWVEDGGFLEGEGDRRGKMVRFGGRINYVKGGATKETAPERVYGTAREMNRKANSSSDSYNLTWVLPVSNSTHGYLVRLHFCDIVSKALNELYFNIYINDYSVYKDLDLSAQTSDLASPYYIDLFVNSNPSGNIRISLGPSAISRPWKINAILNGLEIMKIHGVAKFSEPKRKKSHVGILIGYVLGSFVLLSFFLIFLVIVLQWRRRQRKKQKPMLLVNSYSRLELTSTTSAGSNLNPSLRIAFSDILVATSNFDEKNQIGFGGFGKVYKGNLRDGTAVAVKRGSGGDSSSNDGSRQGMSEFQAEILVLTKIRHRHLVSLIGYCDERLEMILVYEFMSNGPLREHLYGSTKPHLSWKQRLEICIGSARGLHYLHTGTAQGIIIHRDVKSSNILLDEDYTASVADFGLSRSGGTHVDKSHVSTGVKGSFGYLDPEYFKTQMLTDKSDVYSFGVVLLEVLCARPVIDRSREWEEVNLAEWGMKWQKKGHIERIVDPKLKDTIDGKSLRKFGETVEKCLAKYGVDRLTMGDVLWNLECVLQLHVSSLASTSEVC